MAEAQQSDALKNLILFMIGVAIIGTIIALVLYYAVDLPAQQAMLHTPAWNSYSIEGYQPPVLMDE